MIGTLKNPYGPVFFPGREPRTRTLFSVGTSSSSEPNRWRLGHFKLAVIAAGSNLRIRCHHDRSLSDAGKIELYDLEKNLGSRMTYPGSIRM